MTDLAQKHCKACRKDAPHVSDEELPALMAAVPEWQVVERDGIRRLERVYSFKNFVAALAYTNVVGAIAEEEGHHPDLLTEWGRVTVTWWSHKIKNIHRNDFIMAAKCDAIYKAADKAA